MLAYRHKRSNQVPDPHSPRRGTLISDTFDEKSRNHTGEDKNEEARRRTVANLVSGLASAPTNDRVFTSSLHQHLRRAWRDGKRYFVYSFCPKCNHGSVLSDRRNRRNKVRGPHSCRRGTHISVTFYPHWGGKLARTRMARHGAVPLQISSPGWRARPRTIASSKVANTSIYDHLGAMGNAVSCAFVV